MSFYAAAVAFSAVIAISAGQLSAQPLAPQPSDASAILEPLNSLGGAAPSSDLTRTTADGPAADSPADHTLAGAADGSASATLFDVQSWVAPERLQTTVAFMLMISVISLAPAMLLMTTSFVRIVVVLGILRQAIGLQQLPPAQVTTALALFMTALVMMPVWQEIKRDAIDPYTASQGQMDFQQAWDNAVRPLKKFMSHQIHRANNTNDVWLFYRYLPAEQQSQSPQSFEDIPLHVLLPAFMLSELKVAFLIGFQICLPFMVLDLIVHSVTMSMGMVSLPPAALSLPLKLLLFVLVDGWTLVVGMLLESFARYL